MACSREGDGKKYSRAIVCSGTGRGERKFGAFAVAKGAEHVYNILKYNNTPPYSRQGEHGGKTQQPDIPADGATLKKTDFYYDLPPELIAQTPLERRDASRLLTLDKRTGATEHHVFHELPDFLNEGDCLVMNDSRVIPARLFGTRPTGGSVEVVLLRDLGGGDWECLTRPGRKTQPGTHISFGNGELTAELLRADVDGNNVLHFTFDGIFL